MNAIGRVWILRRISLPLTVCTHVRYNELKRRWSIWEAGRGQGAGAAASNTDPRPLHLIDFVMWTQIKEAHGFRGHVGAIVAQEDLVVAFLSAYTAIAVNDEKIF